MSASRVLEQSGISGQQKMTKEKKKGKGISGSTLKLIADCSMLIDHIAATVLERYIAQIGAFHSDYTNFFNYYDYRQPVCIFYIVMRLLGRPAFLLFCFLLVEGFLRTHSIWKYAVRLASFAVLSEVPFDLALRGKWFVPRYQNVFWTLLLGLLVLWAMEALKKKFPGKIGWLLAILTMTVAFAAAELLCMDYGGIGVLTIVALYMLRENRIRSMLVGSGILILSSAAEITCLLAVPPVQHYNGTRGWKRKYFFYAFYPVHLGILAGICYWMGI